MNRSFMQNVIMTSEAAGNTEAYWQAKLEAGEYLCALPYDHAGSMSVTHEYAEVIVHLTGSAFQKIQLLCNGSDLNLHRLLSGLCAVLFYKYTGKPNQLLGTPIYRQKTNGNYINTLLLLRSQVNPALSFREYLGLISQEIKESLEKQNFPIEALITKQTAAFPRTGPILILEGLQELSYISHLQPELRISCFKTDSAMHCTFAYLTTLYHEQTISRLSSCFLNLISCLVRDWNQPLSQLEIISPEEKKMVMYTFNRTEKEIPAYKTVLDYYDAQVHNTPHRLAVVCGKQSLSYAELNGQVDRLTSVLRKAGACTGEIIPIIVQPSVYMLIGTLAILKSGAAFLPLDPRLPQERMQYILTDSQTRLLLIQDEFKEHLIFGGKKIILDNDEIYIACDTDKEARHNVHAGDRPDPSALAYVIYTSGTTGTPKGTLIEHRSLFNLCLWHRDFYGVTAKDRTTKYASWGFDASIWEIFPYLVTGAAIYIVPDIIKLDMVSLNRFLEEHQITICFLPTQVCEQFMKLENRSLTRLLTGGDTLKFLAQTPYALYNNYGPTENTVVATAGQVRNTDSDISIGKPIANTKIYIFNQDGNPQPVGLPGELYISGIGLARGYLNNTNLTEEKFINHSFLQKERLYRTGDLARWLPDGNLEFLGRIDDQVKIRGYRVELSDIEKNLLLCKGITSSAVLLQKTASGEPCLTCYYAGHEDLTPTKIKTFLTSRLPDYMIPAAWFRLPEMPMTLNGKLDRAKLLAGGKLAAENKAETYLLPEEETERMIARLWEELLGLERVSIDRNFFDLGGNSLLIIRLKERLEHLYPGKVSAADLFAYPTIEKLACFIRQQKPEMRSQAQILLMKLPAAYFSATATQDDDRFLTAALQGVIFTRLIKMAVQRQTTVVDLLLAAYIYALYESTEMKDIRVNYLDDVRVTKHSVLSLAIDMDAIADLPALFREVNRLLQTESDQLTATEVLCPGDTTAIKKLNEEAALLFTVTHDIPEQLLPGYDLIVSCEGTSSGINLGYEYNSQCLNKLAVTRLLETHISVLKALTDLLDDK